MAESKSTPSLDGIAVVGMAGRFPGARNCDEFWENLKEGKESLTFFTEEELAAAGCMLGPNAAKRTRSRGVVQEAEMFDAGFFGYTPREAEIMDPQQRVFLEVAWTALENAGFDPDRVPGAVGVFAGASINTYYPTNVMSRPDVLGPFGVFPAIALNEKDFLATRVAYKLNLRGPAISVQTACSTSLVAVCNACQSLLTYESDIALAGGVAINYPQCHSYIHEEGGMISEDGHCKPFDKNASGTLFSDGAGVVVLRRLEDAVNDGDTVLAVIKGYALNNDGSDKAGFTAPSIKGQSEVIQMAQAFGDIEPDTISYVEAHGTATPLGDPIEIAGLTQAFRTRTDASQFCAIGSVKSNIGHLDVAAGIAGLIKTVLAIRHGDLPPTINYTGPNPKIDFSTTPFHVVENLTKWIPPVGVPRRAGVSSFGIGGTNAHVILEEAPDVGHSGDSRKYQLLPISARSKAAVEKATVNLAEHLSNHPELPLADAAFTLQQGRYQFNQRRFVVCRDREDALSELGADRASEHPVLTPARHNPPVVFMFPGQGAQRVNMGRELYETESLYREIVDTCSEALVAELKVDLRKVLYPAPDNVSWAEDMIVQTRITQPALFVTEYALARLWMSWGIHPRAMIGHSVGEYVAACLAGVFSVEDGLKLIAARGRMIQEQPTGTMLAVMDGEDAVRKLLVTGVSVATINATSLCVVSGSHENIERMEEVLTQAKLEYRPLHTSHAFHSEMMEPVVGPFTKMLEDVQLNAPQLPFVSNLTAQWITEGEATDPAYWAQHLRQAVRFADGAAVLLGKEQQQVLLEVGPGATLTSLTRMHPAKSPAHVIVPSLASPIPGQQSDWSCVLSAMGRMWQAGVDVDWAAYYGSETRQRIPLPTYPFERKRYFVSPGNSLFATAPAGPAGNNVEQAGKEPAESEDGSEPASPRSRILDRVREALHALSGLGTEELSPNASLLELGFDSLLLSRVCSAVNAEFGVEIGLRQIAEELASISQLVDYIELNSAASAGVADESAIRGSPEQSGASVEVELPMVDAQREVWLAAQIDDDVSRTYNQSYLVRVEGPLRPVTLHESLQLLVDRHDALRTTFSEDGERQTIAPHLTVELATHSLPDSTDATDIERQLDEKVLASTTQLFDLARGPLFRFSLFDLGGERWALLLEIHHLVADGWSWAVLLEELGEIYSAKTAGNEPPARPALQYCDFVSWSDSRDQDARVAKAEKYWIDLLSDKPEELELPTDRPRPSQKTYGSGRIHFDFDPAVVHSLKEAAKKFDCTLFHLLTASFYAWLHRVTGQSDLIVAVPTAGQVASGVRGLRNADRLVGHCVNMLPVRLNCSGDETVREFIQRVKSRFLDARDHQDVSYNNLINKLQWPRDLSRAPLASVSLNFGHVHEVSFDGLNCQTQLPPKAHNFFDLTADTLEGEGKLIVDCKFNRDLFDEETVRRWLVQWERTLISAIGDPDQRVDDQDILADDERRRLESEWNATRQDYPRDLCLHRLVQDRCEQQPDKTAVQCGEDVLTYGDLEERANRFARVLRARGVHRGQHVGICIERSTDMLASALGILKAGAAYVPLDPSFPADRLRYMAEDGELAAIVTTSDLVEPFDFAREQQLLLDSDAHVLDSQPTGPMPPDDALDARPEDAAYLIYTSGSTGKPKGVVVPHRAVVNFLSSMAGKPGLTADDVLVAVTTLSFDIAVLELYLPLTVGARLIIARYEEAMDGTALEGLLQRHGATVMQATPVTWRLLLEAGWTGGPGFKALVGGEALPLDLAKQLLATGLELWNMYGPTETTVWSTCAQVSDSFDRISIGTPIANTTVYVLDGNKKICPIGVPGELYIGGDGVTLGYWKRPELTADRFIEDPFSDVEGARIYGTGDKARWLNDGTLEHLGRLDSQIKVRGYRVELGEIEAQLNDHPDVRQAAVRLWAVSPDDVRIVACCLPEKAGRLVAANLRKHLRVRLPEYMIPQYFLPVDEIPLTANGKIDRRRLPTPVAVESAVTQYAEPIGEIEIELAGIWTDLIHPARPIGRNDKFFEMGGHSLLALRALRRMEQEIGATVDIRILIQENLSEIAARCGQQDDASFDAALKNAHS